MDPRRFCSIFFLSTLPLLAQGQDPDRPGPSQTEEVTSLQREKERLMREIDYVKDRVTNAKDLLTNKFAKRKLSVRAIDAGTSSIAQPMAPALAPRHARLMQEDEAANFPADVMMLVSGTPISRTLFNQLVSQPGANVDASMRGQMALYELIRIEGTAAEFTEGDLESSVQDLMAKLAEGKTITELLPEHSTLPGAEADGRIEITRNSRFGPRLEQVAFDLEVGGTSRPFHHHAGIVVLHKDSVEKGATPELDKVVAHVIQIPYTREPAQLQKVMASISSAQIELVVRDKDTMLLLPMVYRDAEYLPKPLPGEAGEGGETGETRVDATVLMKSLETLQQEMERARAADTDIEKARLPMLEARYERLKAQLSQLHQKQADGDKKDAKDPKDKQD